MNGIATRDDVCLYDLSMAWPEQAQSQIDELQATARAQTAEINRLIDRVEHLERLVHKYINDADGDGR